MANKTFPRGHIQAVAAKHMLKHGVTPAKQDNKEKAIVGIQAELGDKEDARARQVTNWLLSDAHRKEHRLTDLVERLKPAKKAVKAPAKKVAKKSAKTKARKTPKPAATPTSEERAAA